MFDYLDKLRAKPVHVRQRILWATTVALSFLIGGVWWITWNTGAASPAIAEVPTRSPWVVVADVFARAKNDTMAALAEAGSQLQHAAVGSVDYVPPKEESTATASVNENSADETVVSDVTSPEASAESTTNDIALPNTTSEPIHTRPKTLENEGTETVKSGEGDMVQ